MTSYRSLASAPPCSDSFDVLPGGLERVLELIHAPKLGGRIAVTLRVADTHEANFRSITTVLWCLQRKLSSTHCLINCSMEIPRFEAFHQASQYSSYAFAFSPLRTGGGPSNSLSSAELRMFALFTDSWVMEHPLWLNMGGAVTANATWKTRNVSSSFTAILA
jgi:hypothetical protein